MARYQYILKNTNGRTVKDVVDANSKDEAIGKVRSQGGYLISIKEVSGSGSYQGLPGCCA